MSHPIRLYLKVFSSYDIGSKMQYIWGRGQVIIVKVKYVALEKQLPRFPGTALTVYLFGLKLVIWGVTIPRLNC